MKVADRRRTQGLKSLGILMVLLTIFVAMLGILGPGVGRIGSWDIPFMTISYGLGLSIRPQRILHFFE